MSPNKIFGWMLGVGALGSLGLGAVIYYEYEAIDESHEAVASLKVAMGKQLARAWQCG